jgi:hypothetical protein
MEHQWNDIDEKTEGLREKPEPVQLIYHKSHMNCPGSEPGLPW